MLHAVSMLHVHVHAACPCACCMSMSMLHARVHAACSCLSYMSVSTLDVYVSMLQEHAAWSQTREHGEDKGSETDTVMDILLKRYHNTMFTIIVY
jgi:hypothetical protein